MTQRRRPGRTDSRGEGRTPRPVPLPPNRGRHSLKHSDASHAQTCCPQETGRTKPNENVTGRKECRQESLPTFPTGVQIPVGGTSWRPERAEAQDRAQS